MSITPCEVCVRARQEVTCGIEGEVLMGLAAVCWVSPDLVKEEEMLFTLELEMFGSHRQTSHYSHCDLMLTRLDVKCHNSHTSYTTALVNSHQDHYSQGPVSPTQDIDNTRLGSQILFIINLILSRT